LINTISGRGKKEKYLSLCGLQFVFTREDGIIIFLFEDKERAEKLVVDYLNDKATVSPKRFVETLQSLKSLIFGHI